MVKTKVNFTLDDEALQILETISKETTNKKSIVLSEALKCYNNKLNNIETVKQKESMQADIKKIITITYKELIKLVK